MNEPRRASSRLDFDFETIQLVEFGVGHDQGHMTTYVMVPIDSGPQEAIIGMAKSTRDQMISHGPSSLYEPSEKQASTDHLYVPLSDNTVVAIKNLHHADNLSINSNMLNYPNSMFCYFARLTDEQGRRLTAVRRASYFKGMLRHSNMLMSLIDNTLKLVEDRIFKLDNDFDFLVDSRRVHILRPSGFESTGRLREVILNAVSDNVADIQSSLSYVEFSSIETYASSRPRAARYLASIRAGGRAQNVDRAKLLRLCERTRVTVTESDGKLVVDESDILGFLEVLDRRRYEVELITSSPEHYRASSRSSLDG